MTIRLFIIISILYAGTLLGYIKPASAIDFSTWCYGSVAIRDIDIDENGLVWAVGEQGQVAVFNGVAWRKYDERTFVSSLFLTSFSMDIKNHVIYAVKGSNYFNDPISIIKWTPISGWQELFIADRHGYDPILIDYSLDKNGNIWTLLSTSGPGEKNAYLYRWDGQTNTEISSLIGQKIRDWSNNSYYALRVNSLSYDPGGHSFIISLSDQTSGTWFLKYEIDTGHVGQAMAKSNLELTDLIFHNDNIYSLKANNFGVYKFINSNWVYQNIYNVSGGRLEESNGSLFLLGNTAILGYRVTPVTQQFGNLASLPFTSNVYLYSAAAGKYGELYLGGAYGRFGIQLNTVGYTDSSIFTDFTLADTKAITAEARDAVKDSVSTALEEARYANNKLEDLQTAILDLHSRSLLDTIPPTIKIKTVSGAVATSGESIGVVLDVSDNRAGLFSYSVDGTNYSLLPEDNIVNLFLDSQGINVKKIWVQDEAGNRGTGIIIIRKI